MKLLISVLLLLVAAAPARATGEEDNAAATQALVDYFTAYMSLDPKLIAPYYHEPFMFVTAGRASAFATRTDLESWLQPALATLKEKGYGRSEWPQLHVSLLSSGVAIASALVVRYRTDGQEMERFGATYLLRKTGDGWKVAVLTAHDPSKVLKLE